VLLLFFNCVLEETPLFKHVSLRSREINGKTSWLLLGPDGNPIAAFSAFDASLRNSPFNTRNSYCRHLAEFFDYLIEATWLIGQGRALTKLELTDALEAYGDYLLLGTDAVREIANTVAASLPPGKNSSSSIAPKKAALRRFLKLSETVRQEMVELGRLYSTHLMIPDTALLPEIGQKRPLSPAEVKAIQTNSMFAGVVAGGPKELESVTLGDETPITNYKENRAFPFDKVMDFIDAMPTYRDKAFYSLLAASGCRTHEGLQILLSDIDVNEGTVRLVDPHSRPGHPSYRYLLPMQREMLAWKGRTSDVTLLIEPFASVFFQSLQLYLEREYLVHGRHEFVFQYLRGAERGQPYFLSNPGTRLELFHKVLRFVRVFLPKKTGPHGLRHMYGTYLLNYFPRSNGDYGLPVAWVQQLMGHADLKSTLKYARFDHDLIKLEIENANRVLYAHGTPKRLLELKAEALQAQLAKVQRQLAQEGRING